MADDSDSSAAADIETSVLLGYASKDATGDGFSQLGGHPAWLDNHSVPSGALAKCKTCHSLMSLLLQIRGDLAEFPNHERRLYVWTCRKKTCRRKAGSIRAFRATKHSTEASDGVSAVATEKKDRAAALPNLGETLFGVKTTSTGQSNPFSTLNGNGTASNLFSAPGSAQANPFALASSPAISQSSQLPSEADTLPKTFAQRLRLSSPATDQPQQSTVAREAWPEVSAFPEPYPSYAIEAEKEYIDLEPSPAPTGARITRDIGEGNSDSAEDKVAFESSMDRTFQKFADRLAQNPEQVLRYEHGGQPLLYSKTDVVGKLLVPTSADANAKVKTSGAMGSTRIPRCTNCGAERVFELQLTPHAITELEADELSIEGMDWGTIIMGVCREDCQESGRKQGEVGYVEEWVGAQWEELASNKRPT